MAINEEELYREYPCLKEFKDKKCKVCGRPLGQNPYWNFIDLCSWSCYLKQRRKEKK